MLEFPFAHCYVRCLRRDFIETVFEDGRVCPALFVEDAEARKHAAELSYPSIRMMHLEHEVSHTLLAQLLDYPYSPTLYHVAGGIYVPDDERAEEEARVFAFQRFLNTGYIDPRLDEIPLYLLQLAGTRVRQISAHFFAEFP